MSEKTTRKVVCVVPQAGCEKAAEEEQVFITVFAFAKLWGKNKQTKRKAGKKKKNKTTKINQHDKQKLTFPAISVEGKEKPVYL